MKILITGAARRVGRALAQNLAAKGHQIIIHFNHSLADAENLLTDIGGPQAGHALIQCDLSNRLERQGLIPKVIAEQGSLDILINNASTFFCRNLKDETPKQVEENFQINFFAPFELMQAFASNCLSGQIINFLDRRVANIDPEAGTYAFAKKALRDATLACALDWAPAIRVNAIAPGVLLPPTGNRPELWQQETPKIPIAKVSGLDEIANAVNYLIESPSITGEILFVDGGMRLLGSGPSLS